jgi:hypothetical protein
MLFQLFFLLFLFHRPRYDYDILFGLLELGYFELFFSLFFVITLCKITMFSLGCRSRKLRGPQRNPGTVSGRYQKRPMLFTVVLFDFTSLPLSSQLQQAGCTCYTKRKKTEREVRKVQ